MERKEVWVVMAVDIDGARDVIAPHRATLHLQGSKHSGRYQLPRKRGLEVLTTAALKLLRSAIKDIQRISMRQRTADKRNNFKRIYDSPSCQSVYDCPICLAPSLQPKNHVISTQHLRDVQTCINAIRLVYECTTFP